MSFLDIGNGPATAVNSVEEWDLGQAEAKGKNQKDENIIDA